MMKPKLLLLSVLSLLSSVAAGAVEYEPTTTWPYVYEDFMEGRIVTHRGNTLNYDKLNVNIANGRVHYVENGIIMQADLNTIALLVIGDDSYMCVEGRMMKIVKNTASSAVLLKTVIDADAMSSSDIGYGKSSIASTSGLSLSALNSGMDYSVNRSLDDLVSERSEGQVLELREISGIYYKGRFVPASRVDVLGIPGIDKDAAKQFIKTGKIKFNRTDDLAALVDYLYTL